MTYSSSDAYNLTLYSQNLDEDQKLQAEITETERYIRAAARNGKFELFYSAPLVGVPSGNVNDDNILTSLQRRYRDELTGAGYMVSVDPVNGFWLISWSESLYETNVSVYSIRTALSTGGIVTQSINALKAAMDAMTPPPAYEITTMQIGTAFEFTIVASQQDNTVDIGNDLLTALFATGLGYNAGNTSVYKLS